MARLRPRLTTISLVTTCMVMVLGGLSQSSWAQDPDEADKPEETGKAPDETGKKGGAAAGEFEKAMQISDSEKVDKAEEYIDTMITVLKRVLELLEDARGEKDVVKLNCINEKLTSVKGLLKVSEGALVALREAIAKKDAEAAAHEFTKISIAHEKIQQLRAETEACIGEEAHYVGETEVEVEVDEEITDVDPVKPELEGIDIEDFEDIERPPPASPYQ